MSITRPVIYFNKSCYIDMTHAYNFAGNKHDSSSLVSPDHSCPSHTDERVPRTTERAKDQGNMCAQVSGRASEQKQELQLAIALCIYIYIYMHSQELQHIYVCCIALNIHRVQEFQLARARYEIRYIYIYSKSSICQSSLSIYIEHIQRAYLSLYVCIDIDMYIYSKSSTCQSSLSIYIEHMYRALSCYVYRYIDIYTYSKSSTCQSSLCIYMHISQGYLSFSIYVDIEKCMESKSSVCQSSLSLCIQIISLSMYRVLSIYRVRSIYLWVTQSEAAYLSLYIEYALYIQRQIYGASLSLYIQSSTYIERNIQSISLSIYIEHKCRNRFVYMQKSICMYIARALYARACQLELLHSLSIQKYGAHAPSLSICIYRNLYICSICIEREYVYAYIYIYVYILDVYIYIQSYKPLAL